jgi:ubiquinone/menaquinone biosynthesis C-methylase UbiE
MITVSPARGYEIWAESYDSEANPLLALESRALSGILDELSPARVVDVGCGTGRWMSKFSGPLRRIVGLDASPHMLSYAARKRGLKDHVIAAEADHLPLVAQWADLTLCSLSLGYFADLPRVFREFARITGPAGYVLVSDLHPDAIAAGWTRSFRAGGTTYNIANQSHSLVSVQLAAKRAGLKLEHCQGIHFGMPEYSIFEQAGKGKLFEHLAAIPALAFHLWQNPC